MKLRISRRTITAEVDEIDYFRCAEHKWSMDGSKHLRGSVNGTVITLAAFVMGDATKMWDHIDRNPLNNKRNNLRPCNKSQNAANSPKRKNCTSKYKGVTWYKRDQVWQAFIIYQQKKRHLGYYKSEEMAAQIYNNTAYKIYGEFANLNIIEIV